MANYPEFGESSEDQPFGLEARAGRPTTGPNQEAKKRTWSREFIELAGSAPDFPYPDEPLPAEPGPKFEE